jgi:diguanylate cyclase
MNAGADLAAIERWLTEADPRIGRNADVAAAAATEARQLALRLGRSMDAARAGAWLAVALFRQGHMQQMRQQADAVLPELRSAAFDAERHDLLRLLVLACSEIGAFEAALDAAQRLVREGASAGPGVALEGAFALGACFDRMGDPWQAMRVLREALDRDGGAAPEHARLLALNALCAVAIGTFLRLRGGAPDSECRAVLDEAGQAGRAARGLLAGGVDPTREVAVLGNLGEVLVLQGELDAGEQLLGEASARAGVLGVRAYGWRVRASRGDLLLARDEPAAALAEMEALLAEMQASPDGAPLSTEWRVRDTAYRAARRLGHTERALEQFEQAARLDRQRTLAQLRAQSQLFVTRAEAQQAQWQAEKAREEAAQHSLRAAEYKVRAEQDGLTGLANRQHFEQRIGELVPGLASTRRALTLVLLDIDHFKAINDQHGHAVGDAVLVGLAQVLRDNMRDGDVIARIGGEEFVLVLPGMGPERALEVCERLRERVAAHRFADCPAELVVTASFGLASAPPYDGKLLLAKADAALYGAKAAGRNRVLAAADS